jgi:hypothetical protein
LAILGHFGDFGQLWVFWDPLAILGPFWAKNLAIFFNVNVVITFVEKLL